MNPGIINKNIQIFPFCFNLVGTFGSESFPGKISFDQKTFLPFFFYQSFGFFGIIITFFVDYGNICTFSCKVNGYSLTYTTVSPEMTAFLPDSFRLPDNRPG